MSSYYVVLVAATVVAVGALVRANVFDDEIALAERSDELARLYQRAVEDMPAGPLVFGPKYISGGAGEGSQRLSPEGQYPNRHEVKTDAVLPSYCEPPNPCPKGYHGSDGCQEAGFENTAEYSRAYQGHQNCMCDEEHMFNCPKKQANPIDDADANEFNDALEDMMLKSGIIAHKETIAKKGHNSHSYMSASASRK